MKLDGLPDCIDVHASAGAAGRFEARASLMLHAIAVDEADGVTPIIIADCERRAAESVLQAAGLRAAVYFGVDIMPFLQLGQGLRRGDVLGRVVALVNSPNDTYVAIHWDGYQLDDLENIDPEVLADDLRAGVLVLA